MGGPYGLSFLRLLRETHPDIFGITGRANCWWKGLDPTGVYDPSFGYGYILFQPNGRPAVKIWVFVDDFLIHGPDYESTAEALKFFLDTAVNVGLLCHPGKCYPPSQEAKYCGFIFDTQGIPQLRIPQAKRERARAMIRHVLGSSLSFEHSRLGLSVMGGLLESMSEATPRRLGHTNLRRFHSLVHPPGLGTGAAPYYTRVALTQAVRNDLAWWDACLTSLVGRAARTKRSGTLIPSWGDGCGSGTEGTLGLPDAPLQMWMGQWAPVVFAFSSNWKELKTLELTLVQLEQADPKAVYATTVFYFTDNSTVYWVMASGSSKSPGLHALVERIHRLEIRLGCNLQVVHVPGLLMIRQGTDGLSRGVWATTLHDLDDATRLNTAVFDPLPPDYGLVTGVLAYLALDVPWSLRSWEGPWDGRSMFSTLNVWFPPPEIARQVICFMLETWVEQPSTTSALFFVPRVVPAFWHGLSRHLIELPLLKPHEPWIPFSNPPSLPIPIVVLYLPPFVRHLPLSLPPTRLVPPASHATYQWHQEQAADMHGVSWDTTE